MATVFRRRAKGLAVVFLSALAVLAFVGVVSADDDEIPLGIVPGGSGMSAFGDLSVTTPDAGGVTVDARDTIEPALTALLTVEDVPGSTVTVSTESTLLVQPTATATSE